MIEGGENGEQKNHRMVRCNLRTSAVRFNIEKYRYRKLLHNDLEIYLYTNQGNYRASWFADDIIFTVSFYPNSPDSITEQEFLMIVESIPK